MQGLLPTDPAQMATTGFWRIILGTPIVSCSINAIMFIVMIRHDSVDFLIDRMQFEQAREHLKMVYQYDQEYKIENELDRLKALRLES
jgi:hypothetical protein